MMNTDLAECEANLLSALAELLIHAGRDRAADVIYAAMEAEVAGAPRRPPVLKLVQSAEPA